MVRDLRNDPKIPRWIRCVRLEDHPTVQRSVPFLRDPIHKRITLWLFNIAMGNGSFIDDFPMDTSIYKGFSMAMLNNQMVLIGGFYHLRKYYILVNGKDYPIYYGK